MSIDWDWRLGNIYFNSRQEPDDLGCVWVMDTPEGWDSAEFRSTSSDIPFADGADVADGFYGARVIHGAGTVLGPDAAAIERAKRRLRQEVGNLARVDGQFYGRPDDDTADVYCTVRMGGKVSFPTRSGPQIVDFDFVLIAGDHRKYSVGTNSIVVSSSTPVGGVLFPAQFPILFSPDIDTLTATDTSLNNGDLPAPFVATFIGPLRNPILIDRTSGSRLPLKMDIPAGRSVTVDTLAQTVISDGTNVYNVFNDVTGTPLSDLFIPAADEFGNPGASNWLLLGNGSGTVTIVSHSVYS